VKTLQIIFSLLFSLAAQAQITFERSYSGSGNDGGGCVRQTKDGGFIISGGTNNQNGVGSDIYLIKTDALGNSLWSKSFAGASDGFANWVQQTTDGGYILTGETAVGSGNTEVLLLKTDSVGILQWKKTYGGPNNEDGVVVQQTSDGGFIIIGTSYSFSAGGLPVSTIYILKTSSNGSLQWAKSFGNYGINAYGSHIFQTEEGGFIITGTFQRIENNSTLNAICLIKIKQNGTPEWSKSFYGTGAYNYMGSSVKKCVDKGYILTGIARNNSSGNGHIILLKTDSIGILQWSKTFGDTSDIYSYGIEVTNDNGYIISGYRRSLDWNPIFTSYLAKTNSNGSIQWAKQYNSSEEPGCQNAQVTNDGGFIFTTSVFGHSHGPSNSADVYLLKTDSQGNAGCTGGSLNLTETYLPVLDTILPVQISSGGTENIPVFQIGSGCKDSVLCGAINIIENARATMITIFPNPSSGIFTVVMQNPELKAKISVRDVLGNCLLERHYQEGFTVNLSRYSPGVYFVEILSETGSISKKIVKE
jgi:hypothetical protein